MSQDETTNSATLLRAGSPKDNLPKLAELARQAFEQKRTKECLDLTRSILLIDPSHTTAQFIRSALQSELLRDLDTARAFIRSAQSKEAVKSEPEPGVVPDVPHIFIAKAVDHEVVEDRSPDPVPVNPTPQTEPPATKDARPQVAAYSKPRSARRWLSVTVVVAAALLGAGIRLGHEQNLDLL